MLRACPKPYLTTSTGALPEGALAGSDDLGQNPTAQNLAAAAREAIPRRLR
jgi:hypothetical protein